MIKTSGYRVSPTEVEEAAYATGLVRDAVAFGVDEPARPADRAGRRDGDGRTRPGGAHRRLQARAAALHGARVVDVRDELPRSPNGKFDRALLRQELRP